VIDEIPSQKLEPVPLILAKSKVVEEINGSKFKRKRDRSEGKRKKGLWVLA